MRKWKGQDGREKRKRDGGSSGGDVVRRTEKRGAIRFSCLLGWVGDKLG